MKKISDYDHEKLCECFDCFNMKQHAGKDITKVNIELRDRDDSELLPITLERGKFLSYCGVKFAKVDSEGIIHVFKDFMKG